MLTEIKLYGHLREHTGRSSFKAKVNNPADAVKFLLANFPSLEGEMIEQYYQVAVRGESVSKDQLHDPTGSGTIEFIPVLVGQGSGFRNIIIGAIIIAVAWYASPAALSAFGTAGGGIAGVTAGLGKMGIVAKTLTYMGAFLVFNGIAELFAPGEEPDAKDPQSAQFSGAVNTTLATTPIPIIYGEVITGSIVISAGIDTAELNLSSAADSSNLTNSKGNSVSVNTDEDGTYKSEYKRVGVAGEPWEDGEGSHLDRMNIRIYRENDDDGNVKIELQNGNIQDDDGYKYAGSYTDTELKTALNNNFAQNNFSLGIQISDSSDANVFYPGTLVEKIPDNENQFPTAGTTDDGDDGTWENGFYYSVIIGAKKKTFFNSLI